MDTSGFKSLILQPLNWLPGFDHPFFKIDFETILHTWFAILIIIILIIIIRINLQKQTGIIRYLTLEFFKNFIELNKQSFGNFNFNYFALTTALFIFILICNIASIIPGLEEPTSRLNTTFALGLVMFFYNQYQAIKVHGIVDYAKEYFQPFFLMLPLNIIGRCANIISISFRLFGNILGGAIIGTLYLEFISRSAWLESAGILSGINFLLIGFFTIFEGSMQAFVFCMLATSYLSTAILGEFQE
ncbi:MAG: ATP synthase subunit a [candidate division TM6 bacterium GW2011_GWF2_32_72]|nr:MAG: ATP synthase subunit a [candidate division TM6 bacterium GW2011_GWF2_32_72]